MLRLRSGPTGCSLSSRKIPRRGRLAPLVAQAEADLLYDIYEHAAGLQALDDY